MSLSTNFIQRVTNRRFEPSNNDKYIDTRKLPKNIKTYILTLTNKQQYSITGDQVEIMMNAKNTFFELGEDVINRAHIVSIDFQSEDSAINFMRTKLLNKEDKKLLIVPERERIGKYDR